MCELRGLSPPSGEGPNPWLQDIEKDESLNDSQKELLTLFETDDAVTHFQVLGRVASELYDHENL